MEIKEMLSKPIFRKWWFWVIIAVFILGLIGAAGEETPESALVNDDVVNSLEDESFGEDFEALCDTLTSMYSSIGTVTCQDDTTWERNNELSPESFPYEYRDINVSFGDEIAYEIKVVANTEDMDYFRESYTCSEISWGDGSCIVDEVGDNIFYAVIFYNEKDEEEVTELSGELKDIINEELSEVE